MAEKLFSQSRRTIRGRDILKAFSPKAASALSRGKPLPDKDGNVVGKGDIKAQTRQVFENIKAVLEAAGDSLITCDDGNYITDESIAKVTTKCAAISISRTRPPARL